MFVQGWPRIVLGQDAFQAGVVAFDGDHGIVHGLADGGLLGVGLEVGPAGFAGHPEDVLGAVLVLVLGVGTGVVTLASHELGAVILERVGDVLQEDEAKDNVLVLRRVHVVAELVRREPELGLEAEVGSRVVLLGARSGHGVLCCARQRSQGMVERATRPCNSLSNGRLDDTRASSRVNA